MKQVEDVVSQRVKIKNKMKELRSEIAELSQKIHGGGGEADETIAIRFYKEIGDEDVADISKVEEQLQDKRRMLEKEKEKLESTQTELLDKLADVKFPLATGPDGIHEEVDKVVFNFASKIDEVVLQEMNELGMTLSTDDIKIAPDKIVVNNARGISDAMHKVMAHVKKIREEALNRNQVDEYAKKLRSRDEKIQKMLYTLYKAGDRALTRKRIEIEANLKPRALRGVLYHVLGNDPYLRKIGRGEYKLTDVGKLVMEKYDEKFGSPIAVKPEEESKRIEDFVEATKRGEASVK